MFTEIVFYTEKLVVAGDCNLPDIVWTYYHAPNSPVYNTFIDFVNNYGFYHASAY